MKQLKDEQDNFPLVYVIVLTYNLREPVRRCLESLRALNYPNYHLIVLDNASTDGTEAMLRAVFPALEVIQTGRNTGYTGGNNCGIERALTNKADYVLILNPDTVLVNPEFVTQMVAYAEQHPDLGIAGPRVFLREPGVIQNTVLFPPGLWRNIIHWFRYRINPRFSELSGNEVVEARVLNGVCLLIRTKCLREIGLFDENIFMYVEDVEMDYRARCAGWQIKYLPIDSVVHQQKLEGYQITSCVNFLLKRNAVYYLCKIGKRLDAWCYAALSLVLLLLRAFIPYERTKCREYLQFSKRLVLAYRQILLNQPFDKSFGPPFD